MGPEAVTMLLRLLPGNIAEQVLTCLDAADAAKVRDSIRATTPVSLSPALQDRVLNDFFQAFRGGQTAAPPAPEAPAPKPPTPPPAPQDNGDLDADPVGYLRKFDPALLVRAMESEQPATVALIVGRLDAGPASEILKNLAPAQRAEVAIRLSQTGSPNPRLLERLARAVANKAKALADVPTEPTPEERYRSLAAVFRRLGRTERAEVLKAIEQTDPKTVAGIREQMFHFDDLLLVLDRPLQELLAEIDLKTLATGLKDAPETIREKIFRNTSSRNRQLLEDEISLLGRISKSAVEEARRKIVDLLRHHEEQGKLALEMS